jgi:putative transposase
MLTLKADVDVPDIPAEGHALGLDVGLAYFLSTSEGDQVSRPRFFNKLHRKPKSLRRRLKGKWTISRGSHD